MKRIEGEINKYQRKQKGFGDFFLRERKKYAEGGTWFSAPYFYLDTSIYLLVEDLEMASSSSPACPVERACGVT